MQGIRTTSKTPKKISDSYNKDLATLIGLGGGGATALSSSFMVPPLGATLLNACKSH